MPHELAGALQQASWIGQRCALKEPDVYVRTEYIDVAEGNISQTCNRTAVVQELADFISTVPHYLKPLMGDGSQFTCMLIHPRINGGIPLDCAVESQQFHPHRRRVFDVSPQALPLITNDRRNRIALGITMNLSSWPS